MCSEDCDSIAACAAGCWTKMRPGIDVVLALGSRHRLGTIGDMKVRFLFAPKNLAMTWVISTDYMSLVSACSFVVSLCSVSLEIGNLGDSKIHVSMFFLAKWYLWTKNICCRGRKTLQWIAVQGPCAATPGVFLDLPPLADGLCKCCAAVAAGKIWLVKWCNLQP